MKLLIITFILLIGLMGLGGCSSPDGPSIDQPPDIDPEEDQQQAGNEDIPSPPSLPED